MNKPIETLDSTPVSPTADLPPEGQATDLPGPGRSPLLMSRHDTALLIIDVQQKLLPHIQRHQMVAWNIRRLVDGARILGVPRLCTEQYPAGLGPTIADLRERLEVDDEKARFSCRDCKNVVRRLDESDIRKILLCGIESHVCVQQTALDFLAMGLDVWVAADAIGSRRSPDHQMALRRMESAGVTLTTSEAALFEWCEVAGIPEFRRISQLVRETPPESSDIDARRPFPRIGPRYVLQTDHVQSPAADDQMVTTLSFIVRRGDTGAEVRRYEGRKVTSAEHPDQLISSEGVTALEIGSDGTSLSLQSADGRIEMVYLPMGEPRTSHPRWKVRRLERHINSEQYRTDYEITFHVIEYMTGEVFREFQGFEHRDETSGGYSHVSGVRQVEISADGRWAVVTAVGRPPDLLELPPETHG